MIANKRLARARGNLCNTRVKPLFNDCTAHADLAIVEHHRLSRRDGPLRLVELEGAATAAQMRDAAWCIGLPVARLGGVKVIDFRCAPTDPVAVQRGKALA